MDRFLEAQDWLNELSSEAAFFRKDTPPSLAIVEDILSALDRPDGFFEWCVVVGGTAGKGTVCRRTEATLLNEGKSVATLCSPHVQVITERIRINGKLISMQDFGDSVCEIRDTSIKHNVTPTYYEAIVCAGILAAKNAKCEVLICEVGMGGRLDAVNAVRGKRIAALTFIGDDHLEKFGGSMRNMAQEKAGIFTPDCELCVSYEKNLCSILEKESSRTILFIKGIREGLNKKMARKICEKIMRHDNFIMQKSKLPCRWEKISSDIILDGSHSMPRFDFLFPKIKKITGKKILIAAMAKNHDPKSFEKVMPEVDHIIWTTIPGGREFWNPEALQKKWGGEVNSDPQKALMAAQKMDGTVIVAGSFYLAGKLREEFFVPQKILEQQTEWPQ